MTPYLVATMLAVGLAMLAGSRVVLDATDQISRPRTGMPWVFAALSGAVLVAFAGLRYRRGTDYGQYVLNYQNFYRDFAWSNFAWDEEHGIQIASWLAVRIHDDYATMFVIMSLITIGLFMRTYAKYSVAFALSVLFFVLVGTFTGTFNGVRQFAAAAIVFAGHNYIVRRKFLRYLAVIVVAALFHFTAIAFILLYFVPRRHLNFLGLAVLVAVALAATNAYDLVAQVWASLRDDDVYSTAYFTSQVNPLRVALAFVPYIAYRMFVDSERLSNRQQFYVNMTLVHGAVLLAASGSALIARFAIYAVPFVSLALPAIILASKPRSRLTIGFVLVSLYAFFWFLEVSRNDALVPFRWVMER